MVGTYVTCIVRETLCSLIPLGFLIVSSWIKKITCTSKSKEMGKVTHPSSSPPSSAQVRAQSLSLFTQHSSPFVLLQVEFTPGLALTLGCVSLASSHPGPLASDLTVSSFSPLTFRSIFLFFLPVLFFLLCHAAWRILASQQGITLVPLRWEHRAWPWTIRRASSHSYWSPPWTLP